MDNKIKIALPGLWNHFYLTRAFIDFIEEHPEIVNDNMVVGAVYDNFPYCIWDGGRIYTDYQQASLEDVKYIKNYFEEKNIPLRLVYTSPVLREEHTLDRFCNLVTGVCESPLNEIVVNSPILEEHLRTNYPNYNYISSTTKCNLFDASKNEMSKDYKYICLDYNQNHNFKELDKLSQEQKDKTEFLCNAICPPGCPYRKEHYRLNGLFYLNYLKTYTLPKCGITDNTLSNTAQHYTNNISPEEILTTYAPKGFSMFKLEGRTLDSQEVLLNYVRYMIKPEHQFWVLSKLLGAIEGPIRM
jgi:hypothetical protein